MQHDEVALDCLRSNILERQAVGRRIDQLRALDKGRWLGEPGRKPERSHLAPHLVPCARTSVEAVV